jgi:hypothetical protein
LSRLKFGEVVLNSRTCFVMSAMLGILLLTTPAFAQTKGSNTANSDPVVCFDDVLRDAENALQAYSIALTRAWTQEANCRQQAPSADELGACWDLLLEARPLISQAGNLNEQAQRASSPDDADRLSQQAGALMRRAADLVRKARDCFNPVFAQWQKNGGRYIAAKGTTSDSGASSAPQVPSLPPVGLPGPGPRRPAVSPPKPSEPDNASSPATLSVRIAARKAADTIVAGNDSRTALGELNKAQQALPPNVPRPIQCWGMMVDAASKRNVEPGYAIPQAQRAAACYDGQGVGVAGRQQPETTRPRNRPIACSVQRPKGDPVAEFPWSKEDADALYQYGVFEGVTDCIADPRQLCPLVAGLALGRIKLAAEILAVLGNLQAAQALLEGPPPHSTNPNIIKRGIEDGGQYCAYYARVVGGAVRKGPLPESPNTGARPPTTRTTETPAATSVPSDAKVINDSTSDRYFVWDSSNPQFKAFAHVEDDEIFINLRTELETANGVVKSAVLRGSEQFQRILQFFAGRFKGIRGSWSFGTNLEAFNKAILAGMSPVDAARLETWTGQQATKAGYSRVVIRSLEGPAGHYSKVTVSFFHP